MQVDDDLREVGFGALTAMFLRAVGALLTFGVNIVVARLLGAADTGLYFSALATITIGRLVNVNPRHNNRSNSANDRYV